jgi:hypothetical protein
MEAWIGSSAVDLWLVFVEEVIPVEMIELGFDEELREGRIKLEGETATRKLKILTLT